MLISANGSVRRRVWAFEQASSWDSRAVDYVRLLSDSKGATQIVLLGCEQGLELDEEREVVGPVDPGQQAGCLKGEVAHR